VKNGAGDENKSNTHFGCTTSRTTVNGASPVPQIPHQMLCSSDAQPGNMIVAFPSSDVQQLNVVVVSDVTLIFAYVIFASVCHCRSSQELYCE
jgi:hypothetical protein